MGEAPFEKMDIEAVRRMKVDRLVILQPGYLPWLGFFEQLKRCDLFIVADALQFTKQSWRVRNRVLTPNGPQWLTVPTVQDGRYTAAIREVKVSDKPWAEKHWNVIRNSYCKAPHFKLYAPFFEQVYMERRWEFLLDLDMHVTQQIARWLDIATPMALMSDTGIRFENDKKSDSIIEVCKYVGAKVFYEGASGKEYLSGEEFARAGIDLEFQDYQCKPYRQLHADQFVSHLSAIDLLFNEGPAGKNFV